MASTDTWRAIFKAYDIRGTVPDRLDEHGAYAIGRGFAAFLKEETKAAAPLVVVGRDVRHSSPALALALAQGIESGGCRIIDIGICTTPMLYCAVGALTQAPDVPCGGVMVTASHNGPKYNGFKLCRSGAVPISETSGLKRVMELGEQYLTAYAKGESQPRTAALLTPSAQAWPDLKAQAAVATPQCATPHGCDANLWAAYVAHVARFKRRWPATVKLAVDPANGMGCLYLPVLRALGAAVESVNDALDGAFPAHEANPIKLENLADTRTLVKQTHATLGVSYDGDADRVVFVDERGEPVAADLLTAILARSFLAREPGAAILYDLRSSRAVPEIIREAGGRPVRERVGHSFMKARLRAEHCALGGELSGHYYFRDSFHADSSLVATIEVLNAMGQTGKTLGALRAEVARYHQSGEINFTVADKDSVFAKLRERYRDGKLDTLDGITAQYDAWWFNARLSNTEPLLRLNVEANSVEELAKRLKELGAIIGSVS